MDRRRGDGHPPLDEVPALFVEGEFEAAAIALHHHLAVARDDGDAASEVKALAWLGQIDGRLGRWLQAIERLDEALRIAGREGVDPVSAPIDLAMVHARLGEVDRALELIRVALEGYEARGDDFRAAIAQGNLGHFLLQAGRHQEATQAFREAVRRARAAGDDSRLVGGYTGAIRAAVEAGRLDEARDLLADFEAATEGSDLSAYQRAHLAWGRAWVLLSTRQPGALAAARECLGPVDRDDRRYERLDALLLCARAAAAEGDYEAAWDYERRARHLQEDLVRVRRDEALALERSRHAAERARVRSEALEDANARLEETLEAFRVQAAELEAARDRAQAAVRAENRFLGVVSHELRTPLNGILGAVDLLRTTELDTRQRRLLGVIRGSGELMLGVVGDLLDVSRLEAGRLSLEPGPAVLPELLEDTLALLASIAADRGLTLELCLEEGLPVDVILDARRFRQILLNLVSNGLKFTPEGQVRVTAQPFDGGVRIRVDDQGPGVPEQERERIFGRFEQGSEGVDRPHGGAGLGLAIARQLTRLFDGRLQVMDAPDGGARFELELPHAPGAIGGRLPETRTRVLADPEAGAVALSEGPSHPDLDVLLVDDEPISRRVEAELLRRLGARVVAVASGREAVASLERGHPDAVFLDWMMPEMDGPATARALREAGYRGPILALTAHAGPEAREACLSAGMQAVYAKPVRLADLRAALDRWAPVGEGPRIG